MTGGRWLAADITLPHLDSSLTIITVSKLTKQDVVGRTGQDRAGQTVRLMICRIDNIGHDRISRGLKKIGYDMTS